MNKFWIVLGHTYVTKLKSKAFIISTAITLLFAIAMMNIDVIIKWFAPDEENIVLVQDETDTYAASLASLIEPIDEDIELKPYDGSIDEAKKLVEDESVDGLLVLETNAKKLPEATYYENKASESGVQTVIHQQLQQLKVAIATEQAGVDEEALLAINEAVTFEKVALDEATKTDEELNQARFVVYIMLFVLYMAVIIYGQMIATEVATEKSSRVMEILISSAPPVTHMFAKIFGIALLGLTQIAVVLLVSMSFIKYKINLNPEVEDMLESVGVTSISFSVYLYALLFFVLGYLLYATIAAMLGSLVSRVEDVQQLIMPMIILIMIAFFIAMFGLTVPDAKFITITSYIPFFTPMIMFLRIGMLEIAAWEIILSIGILIATIIVLALIGARIYRGGVLMYGPSRSLKDIKNAFALSKKEK
ncbi:MAG TPA: ABC transporter permease [Pseudogracilibacillus sp.]|nr:ABC transporter permease [Pseudogracilibacillus sp.]